VLSKKRIAREKGALDKLIAIKEANKEKPPEGKQTIMVVRDKRGNIVSLEKESETISVMRDNKGNIISLEKENK